MNTAATSASGRLGTSMPPRASHADAATTAAATPTTTHSPNASWPTHSVGTVTNTTAVGTASDAPRSGASGSSRAANGSPTTSSAW